MLVLSKNNLIQELNIIEAFTSDNGEDQKLINNSNNYNNQFFHP